ncbi:MAG: lipopolysaccharide assembly protein LapB, partial [Xanthomonadales bacterium]|nr:lipopolysaccharide assembly protein LapB [Xanthomonadales bacterium]
LLNEQPDKAIEVFLQIAEPDSDTLETQLALGNLFRRRGEVDRAIRLHQNLFTRPLLSAEQRSVALVELGEDYLRAGLLDRAEALFKELLAVEGHQAVALQQLIQIYQQEQDWDSAIAAAEELQSQGGASMSELIAQFLCELADRALIAGDRPRARELLEDALDRRRDCLRAHLQLGRIEMSEQRWQPASRHFEAVARADANFISEVVAPLTQALLELGEPRRARRLLLEFMDREQGCASLICLVEMVQLEQGRHDAIDLLAERLHERPSVRGVRRLLELSFPPGERGNESVDLVRDILDKLLARDASYRCSHCGFRPRTLHWQCPSCKRWGTIKPVHGLVGD